MKKFIGFLGVFAFMVGMVFGQNNEAEVEQNDNSNTSNTMQQGSYNSAYTGQINGDSNQAAINQSGDGNQTWLTQGMIEGQWGLQTSNLQGSNNQATISQIGDNNMVDHLKQVGDYNNRSITQTGDGNKAYSYQGWAFGFWGETDVTSALSSNNSTVNISQIHDNNFAAVWQYGGNNNEANINQTGTGNSTQIAQGFIYEDANYNFSHPLFNTQDNVATVNQDGVDNSAKLFQLGDGNSFTLIQNGNNNTLGGRGLSGLEAVRNGYFEQDGDGNIFVGTQNDGATLVDTSRQTGDYNNIFMIQGEGDIATIIQDGDLNNVNMQQFGQFNTSTITQTGNSNTANVTQTP